ncbi:MAG: dioxygenase, partial [Gaiellaceae bacterium]
THLHGFAAEVGLRQSEWEAGIEFLTQVGEITDENRQEFILLSDTLGFSTLVDALAGVAPGTATESTILGPFWAANSPLREYGDSIAEQPGGDPAWVYGCIRDVEGRPIGGVELDVWQAASEGLYAVQDPDAPEAHLRGRFLTRDDGNYAFLGVLPAPYSIPTDGPVGRMLAATKRDSWRPAHIHMIATKAGFERLVTHIFEAETPYLDADPVFGVKPSLIRTFVPRAADDPEAPPGVSGAWYSVANDLVLAPSSAASPGGGSP